MDKDYLVTKSNYFIMNSSYDLSLEEQKIILTLASMVQPSDKEFKPYIFKIADFIKLLGIETQTKYTEIPKITKELMKKVFEIHEGNKLIQTAWLSGAVYEKGTGYVELIFSPYLKPYMLQLKEKFTQYQLANVLSMKSKYSPRIYEILKCNEFKKQGYIEIEIDELRKLLKCDEIYPLYADFKRKVIIQTQKELKKLTDIHFNFEEIKTGRKVTSLNFYIHSNKSKETKESTKVLINVDNEISVTLKEAPGEKISKDMALGIKRVKYIMSEHELSDVEALKILRSSDSDFKTIEFVYRHLKNKPADNFIALIISMVKPGAFIAPKKNYSKDTFTDYKQRSYDGSDGGMTMDELERKLLGWDNLRNEESGEEYQQEKINM